MAAHRIQVPFVVDTLVTVEGKQVSTPVVGATVVIKKRSDLAVATVFENETEGGIIVPTTDSNGRITGWLPEEAYIIEVTGGKPFIATATMAWDAVSGQGIEHIKAEAVILNDLLLAIQEALVPTGALFSYASDSAPAGFLLCDGKAYLRSEFPALYERIKTKWGETAGDGKHFNVPDYRGRTQVGAGAGPGLTARTLAETGGEEKHTNTTSEIPAHIHSIVPVAFGISTSGSLGGSAADHLHHQPENGAHGVGGYVVWRDAESASKLFLCGTSTSGRGSDLVAGVPQSAQTLNLTGSSDRAIGVSVSGTLFGTALTPASATVSTGGSEPHNNMQPYTVANVIIKT